MPFKIESTDFSDGSLISKKYTCDGDNISPPIKWTNVPNKTVSFSLTCSDLDALKGEFVHWIVYNIGTYIRSLPEGTKKIKEGLNDFGKAAYGGPCPPSGVHRYFFKLYALKKRLSFKKQPNKQEFLDSLKGHVIAEAELMGIYKKDKISKIAESIVSKHQLKISKIVFDIMLKYTIDRVIAQYISFDMTLKGGYFYIYDKKTNQSYKLTFSRLHEDSLGYVGEQTYFACVDFKDKDGIIYDLDFFVVMAPKIRIYKIDIHHIGEETRYDWKEENGVWSQIKKA